MLRMTWGVFLRIKRRQLIPPSLWLIYFKQVSGRGVIETGHVLEREGLFNLVKMVVSGPLRTVRHFFKSLRSVRIVTWIMRTVTVRVYWTTLPSLFNIANSNIKVFKNRGTIKHCKITLKLLTVFFELQLTVWVPKVEPSYEALGTPVLDPSYPRLIQSHFNHPRRTTWQFTLSTQFNVHLSVFWQKALETNSKTFDTGKVYSRMWLWGISVKTMPQKILAVRSFLRRGLFCVVGRQKRKRASDVPTGLLLCDYGYPARASAEERGQCDKKRGAETI